MNPTPIPMFRTAEAAKTWLDTNIAAGERLRWGIVQMPGVGGLDRVFLLVAPRPLPS